MNDIKSQNQTLLEQGLSMKKLSIAGIVLFCTIIGIIPSVIIAIVLAIKLLTSDYKDEELNGEKMIWGLLSLLLIGNIASLIFANKIIEKANNKIAMENNQKETKNTSDINPKITLIDSK